jgi:hypothetical protein
MRAAARRAGLVLAAAVVLAGLAAGFIWLGYLGNMFTVKM